MRPVINNNPLSRIVSRSSAAWLLDTYKCKPFKLEFISYIPLDKQYYVRSCALLLLLFLKAIVANDTDE